jgi:hypothetical protein
LRRIGLGANDHMKDTMRNIFDAYRSQVAEARSLMD